MFDRRRFLQLGLAAASMPLATARLGAQGVPRVKIRYSEVVHSILYTPAYVALTKGYFEERGLDVALTTAQGGDKAIAALMGGNADIGLIGPETAVYVQNSESPIKARMFCGLTATDGYMLMGREKVDNFDWSSLQDKEIMGWRTGSTPLLFLEAALRMKGLDPGKDVKLNNSIAIPARVGAWQSGQTNYAIFGEPDASQLELEGKAHFLASIGETVGFVDYTAFIATDKYIRDNPAVMQSWTDAVVKAQKWTASAATPDIVKALEPHFPGVSPQAMAAGVERYRRLKIWKATPKIEAPAIDRFQDILVQGHVLDASKRVRSTDLLVNEFASKAS
jgi:NitT/TauT family transport system substrate-binding protein